MDRLMAELSELEQPALTEKSVPASSDSSDSKQFNSNNSVTTFSVSDNGSISSLDSTSSISTTDSTQQNLGTSEPQVQSVITKGSSETSTLQNEVYQQLAELFDDAQDRISVYI